MKSQWMVGIMVGVFAVSLAGAQTPSACPLELSEFHVSSLSVHIRNTSSKPIAGMVFNVAFSDATERWKWLHWNYDLTRPLQEFGWNKVVKAGEEKKLGGSVLS